jgi:hypothetical protein
MVGRARPQEDHEMNKLKNIAAAAAMTISFAGAVAAPAQAGVSVGIGIGVPAGPGYGYHRGWCFNHPGACGRPGYVAVGGPVYADGFYLAGHGYWHGGRWWGHRDFFHGGWRFR